MRLEQKAFLITFCGASMFLLLTMLPAMYFVDVYIFKLHNIQWFAQFAMAFILVSALIAGMVIVLLEVDKDKRVVQLQIAIHDGWNFILRWNLVGWSILLWRKRFAIATAVSVLSHQMCHDDEVPEK